ncbi:MAG: ABC transporter permease [Nitrososphaerota archaeon]
MTYKSSSIFSFLTFLVKIFKKYPAILFIIILVIFSSIIEPVFLTLDNFRAILSYVSITGIVTIGMMLAVLLGMFDLSVGGVLCLTATIFCIWHMGYYYTYLPEPGTIMFIKELNPVLPSFLILIVALLIATTIGLMNGFVISYFGIPSIVTTLGTLILSRGLAWTISGGNPLYTIPDYIKYFAQGTIGGVPLITFLWLLLLILTGVILNYSSFGRAIYQVGGNPEAAYTAGVRLIATKSIALALSGLLAGLSGLLMIGRTGVMHPHYGMGIELDALAAVVIGGISLRGGKGGVLNAFCGILFLGMLTNIMTLMVIEAITQYLIKGLFLIGMVLFEKYLEVR